MNKNERFVITINRELGSGGRTVGRKLAERMGVEYYDKAVIKGLQEKFNLTIEEIEKLKGHKYGWWASFKRQMTGSVVSSNMYIPRVANEADKLDTHKVFQAATEILKGIAADESCIVAGRSGFFVFRDHPNHLSILIQASLPSRVARLVRKQGISEDEARKTIEQVDEMRENYVQEFTKTSRYDTRNYQLVISMDHMTEDAAVDIIMDYINKQS